MPASHSSTSASVTASGSVTASNRSLQWREKVIDPLFESRSDQMIMYQLAGKLGFANELTKNYKMQKIKGLDEPLPEDILREINKSVWTIGYTGQSPERLQAHMRNMHAFDVRTLRAKSGKDKINGYDLAGDYFAELGNMEAAAKTGVVARLQGGRPGPVIAVPPCELSCTACTSDNPRLATAMSANPLPPTAGANPKRPGRRLQASRIRPGAPACRRRAPNIPRSLRTPRSIHPNGRESRMLRLWLGREAPASRRDRR